MSSLSNKLYYIYLFIAIIVFIICDAMRYGDLPIYIMPISYAVSLLICHNIRDKFSSLSVMIINSVCLVRYVLYPLMIVIEQSSGSYYVAISREAIYLMVYELLAVQFFLNWYCKRIDISIKLNEGSFGNTELGPYNRILLLSVVPIALLFPSVLSMFRFLGIAKSASVPGPVGVCFDMGMTVVYVYLLTIFSKQKNLLSFVLSITVSVAYIFLTMVGGGNVRRWLFLWVGIPTIIVLLHSYPKYRNAIRTIAVIFIPLGIFYGSFIKFEVTDISILDFVDNFLGSQSLSEYFGGLNGLSFSMTNLAQDAKAASFTSTLTDLFGNMPVVSRLFNPDVYSTQIIYQKLVGRQDLICPLLGQSYAHFGTLGAPLLSLIMVAVAVECDIASKKARTIYELYVLIMMCVTFSLFMCLNTMIILTHAWTLIIFLVIQYFNNKHVCRNPVSCQ